jgi:hypothetical protein
MWQLNERMFDATDQACKSWTPSTPGTLLIDRSNAAISRPLGVASMSTFRASVMIPHELQTMKPPMTSEITGSATGLPVTATKTPAATTPRAETASPTMWR